MLVKCEECGVSFKKKPAEIARTNHNFCSKHCKSVYYYTKSIENKYIIAPNGCWEYIGFRNACGYGMMKYQGKVISAHRVAYMLNKGDIGAYCVLHKCDNPACINPDHLFLGTHLDNMRDMYNKNRNYRKLTKADIAEIRQGKEGSEILAQRYNVSARTIRKYRASEGLIDA